ncbi:MAG: HEAT repeat domain-containing protein [Bacteroidetes bacterium]|nr:HEAT repeat domain-containing protein [Bacteroidota bacterium]
MNPRPLRWNTCIVLLFAFLSVTSLFAQRSLTDPSTRLLDSALAVMGMHRYDLSMPPDLIVADDHRVRAHDRLFTDPLAAFDMADQAKRLSYDRSPDGIDQHAAFMMKTVVLGDHERHVYESAMPADTVIRRLRIDPSVPAGFVGSTVLFQYVSAFLLAHDGVREAHENFRGNPLLADMCDSLWMLSTEDEHGSIWELHDKEVSGMERARTFFAMADPVKMVSVYNHGWSLYQQLMQYVRISGGIKELLRDSVHTVTLKTPYGRIALGGPGNDVYSGEYALILDVGGNDVYHVQNTSKADALAMPIRCIVDLGGDDLYASGSYGMGCGIGGVGIVIDKSGDDTYSTGDFSLACGVFGVGIVHDLAGNDMYTSGLNSQGCGIFGMGVLLDDAGQDMYRAHAQAQGFGATRGYGVLSDLDGNDQYIAASPYTDVLRYEAHYTTFTQGAGLGYRPLASGGFGFLFDRHGNDVYATDIYGQGTGYWFALGALCDDDGEDRYQAYQYAQGAGVHFASGVLRDHLGDDVYVSHGVSQGCGHDIAFGSLIDEAGNDNYVAESLSLGAGNANAVSILIDERGNDSYIATNTTNTMGFSDFRRSYGMIGVFADGGGTDTYGGTGRNNSTSIQSSYGVFADMNVTTTRAGAAPQAEPTYASVPLANSADSLFIQASAAPLRFQNNVKPARERLAAMGLAALPTLASNMGTEMPRERLTLEEVLPKIHAQSPEPINRLIADSIRSDDPIVVALASTLASKVKTSTTLPALLSLSRDSVWRMRRLAGFTIGEIGDTNGAQALRLLIADEHPYVRARAAYALGKIGGTQAFRDLRTVLEDSLQIVRYSAVEGLSRGSRRSANEVSSWWRALTDRDALISGVRLLSCIDTTESNVRELRSWLGATAPKVRTTFLQTLPSMPTYWQRLSPEWVDPVPPTVTKKKKKKKKTMPTP